MRKIFYLSVLLLCFFGLSGAFGQDLKTNVGGNKQLDSLRKNEDGGKDSVVFTAKFIRYTTLRLLKDSIQILPLDTSLNGVQNFSPLIQPQHPTISLGNLGLAAKPLLFEPAKTIGFNAGFHSLDYYAMGIDDIRYYQARSPFTSLYYMNGTLKEQILKVIHSQNIRKNWNFGANFNRIGSNGFYSNQRGDHLNAALFTWYQSKNKRYNILANGIFNTLKASENGSVVNDSIYNQKGTIIPRDAEAVRLTGAKQLYRKNMVFIKQTYFVGRIDSTQQNVSKNILPTNKIAYSFLYDKNTYAFQKDGTDDGTVLPTPLISQGFTNDSTAVNHIQNEFVYSFFLRSKSSVIKNEVKVDAGIRHDYYSLKQFAYKNKDTLFYNYNTAFQNITLLGSAGYRFSNKMDLNVDLQQIIQGRNIGDFLYEAKSNVLLSKVAGRIAMGAYMQNKSPEEIYRHYFGNYYKWQNSFDRTKIANLSFNYINDKFKIDVGASYYLVSKYLYFVQDGAHGILPQQQSGSINLLKLSLAKKFKLGSFNMENYVAYQKTDNNAVLRTPEIYTFNSIYYAKKWFKVLDINIGFDVRYNTTYSAYSYSPAASQFYVGDALVFDSKPIVDVWVKANLRRANLFVKYDYANQGILSQGYYTVNRYPMQDALIKFGVSWNFYD